MQNRKRVVLLDPIGHYNFCIMNVGREREILLDYCYKKLDQIALKQITNNCRDKCFVEDKPQKLKTRIFSSKAQLFVPAWWKG